MSELKLRKFLRESNIDGSLIRAVIKQMGGWETFKNYAPDITNHGIDGGFNGFIYYHDTLKFAEDNLKLILKMADELADSLGDSDGFQVIAGFNCLRNCKIKSGGRAACIIMDKEHEDHDAVMNALAWFAGEEVARSYCDILENEDDD